MSGQQLRRPMFVFKCNFLVLHVYFSYTTLRLAVFFDKESYYYYYYYHHHHHYYYYLIAKVAVDDSSLQVDSQSQPNARFPLPELTARVDG